MVRKEIQAPTSLARRFVRYAVGFGAGVGVGLLPLQRELLVLFPAELQRPLVPLAAFTMGVVALTVQFFFDERIARRTLRRRFLACLMVLALALTFLLYLYVDRIQRVEIPSRDTTIHVLLGPERLATCGCPEGMNDLDCLKNVSLDGMHTCWDTTGTRYAFILTYLLLMSAFGALIGLLLTREAKRSSR